MVLDAELEYVTFLLSLTLKPYVWNSDKWDFCSKLRNIDFLFDSETFKYENPSNLLQCFVGVFSSYVVKQQMIYSGVVPTKKG